MFWTLVWFLVNLLFVASAITYLFMHRAYTEKKRETDDAILLDRLNRRRKLAGALSILLFIAMAAAFMTNMRLNG
ncbi:hypothetical protein KP806_05740 [Paenibacillus sp. N4]|uniref:hypothetical protein n=1 Tax=Paenibacillus vietnamensis TaxID=2590547 RepID=UPI001CD0AC23|nr:hypothetical protein [Paenibacillus vietnamensis]MCA0754545.1 hypothetical protein [Paenibacillus vietnamensis]